MTFEIDEFETLSFPKPGKFLLNYTPEEFLNEWLDIKRRFEYFQYTDRENTNDVREGYEQFMDDADKFLDIFRELVLDITDAMKYYEKVKQHASAIMKVARKQKKDTDKFTASLLDKGIDPIEPMVTVDVIENQISMKAQELIRRNNKLEEVEQEIAITEQVLAKKKSEMELALQTRYSLTEKQKLTLLEEKDKILDGIERWGSVSGALSHDPSIASKASTIMMYCQKFPEFGAAIEVSKQMFKDRLEGIMVERAIEGTENPQFARGEYVGDYKIKDNKLLVELMKAKVPEVYNKKSTETQKNTVNNTMNIISFADIDETKEGYAKNVGVVLDVDNTGKVTRITQEKKMIDFYKNKDGAEIIMPEEPDDRGRIN